MANPSTNTFCSVDMETDIAQHYTQPYNVMKCNAAVGVMVTASHTPNDDPGFKVYSWSDGFQIRSPFDEGCQVYFRTR